jgi:Sulfotransferase domain
MKERGNVIVENATMVVLGTRLSFFPLLKDEMIVMARTSISNSTNRIVNGFLIFILHYWSIVVVFVALLGVMSFLGADKTVENDYFSTTTTVVTPQPSSIKTTIIPQSIKEGVILQSSKPRIVPKPIKARIIPKPSNSTIIPMPSKSTFIPKKPSKTNTTKSGSVSPTPNRVNNSQKLSKTQQLFLNKYCDLGNETSWFLSNDDVDSWRRRAPFFLIIGAKKAGTSSIFKYLIQHPFIVNGGQKELHSFQPRGMRKFKQWNTTEKIGTRVRIDIARQDLYENDYLMPIIKSNSSIISFDATPDYLLYSGHIPQAILCTVPWVKIMVSLRNPIDRLFSHYNFLMDDHLVPEWFSKLRENQTFEEWVEADIKILNSFGLIPNETNPDKFFGSLEEKEAWRNYQRAQIPGDFPIARSLYALQLEDWFQWLREVDRDPSEILFVSEEQLKQNSQDVMERTINWLGLSPILFDTSRREMVTQYTSPKMDPMTRAKLQKFFDPYNQRFYKLMGPEWQNIWD